LLKAVFSIESASRLYNEDPRTAERITERELRVGSRELSTTREVEKKWRYTVVDSWQLAGRN
jgi:hypothetical protein